MAGRIIQNGWISIYELHGIESCRDRLVSWNKLEFGHVGRKIAELQKKFQILELQSGSNINGEVDEVRRALDGWIQKQQCGILNFLMCFAGFCFNWC